MTVFLNHDRIGAEEAPDFGDLSAAIRTAEVLAMSDGLLARQKQIIVDFASALELWCVSESRAQEWTSDTLRRFFSANRDFTVAEMCST